MTPNPVCQRKAKTHIVFDVWQSKYIYLFALLLPRLWGIHLEKKQKFACSESRWLGTEVSPPTAVTRGSNMHTAASRSKFAQTATRQKVKNKKKLKPISISKWENDQSTVSTKYTDTDEFTL